MVKYTDDYTKLIPQILHIGNEFNFNIGQLGVYKNTYWKFQHEWRYVLRFLPISITQMMGSLGAELCKVASGVQLPFSYYYLKIDEQKFKEMEIMLSPQINEGNSKDISGEV